MRSRVARAVHVLARGARWLYDRLPIPLAVRLRHRQWLAERVPGLLVAGGSPRDSVQACARGMAPISIIPIDGEADAWGGVSPAAGASALAASVTVPPCAMPLVSIVVPAHNKWPYTLACIASVVAAEPSLDFEVILADDASTDQTREAQQLLPGLVICRQDANVGFLRNCNMAATRARGRYLVLLNNDTQVQPGALSRMLDVFSLRPDAGLVGAKLVYPDGTLQEAGGIVWRDGSAWNYGKGGDPSCPEFSYLKQTDYCSGACIMVPRELWEQVGGFDERFSPAYYEDTDLAFKVRAAGRAVYYQPTAVVVHFEGTSHGVDVRAGVKAKQAENQRAFRAKWSAVLDLDHAVPGQELFRARDGSRSRPCILVIDHYVPQPDRDAGSRSMWCIIRVLLGMGLNVKFWPHNRHRDPIYTPKLEELGVEVVGCDSASGAFGDWIARHGDDVDCVLLSRPHVSVDFIDDIRRHSRAKVIYYGHDLHHVRIQSQAEISGDVPLRSQARAMRALEESLWRRADLVYYPSFLETAEVERLCPGVAACTIPGFFFDPLGEPPPGPIGRQGILFVAGFAHPPNVDAARWLVHDVMPLVRRRQPGVRLWLAGSNPTGEVKALGSADVTVTGNLSDDELDALYRQCRVAVVPLRYGAGVKHKVLEAMHRGTPLVTTSVGAQGLPELDRAIAVVDGADEVASAIVELLVDDRHWVSTAHRGRDYVQQRYSRQVMHSALAQDVSAAVSRPRPREPARASAQSGGSASSRWRRWLAPVAVMLVLCVVQALVLLRHIGRPGLYYDEILFVNAAVGGLGDEFVSLRVGGVPVMLMPYIGALKAWVWSPIFAVWQVDAASVRVPAIAIGLAGNLLACIAMGRWFGRTAAIVTAFAISFDPTVGMQSRLDWGPNAIMYFCRGGFLLSVALATTGRVRSGLLGMAAFAAAGCFDKLSFLWVVVSGLAMFIVIERELLLGLLRRHRAAAIGWCLTMAAVVGGALLLAIVAPLQPPSTSLAVRVAEAGQLLWSAMAGDGAISVVYWGAAGRHGMQAALALGALVLAAALGLRAVRPQVSEWKRAWMWLCGSCALVALMFTVTRDATGPHHAAVIGGLWQLPFVPPIAAGVSCALAARAQAHRALGQPRSRVTRTAAVQCALVGIVSAICLTTTWRRVGALVEPPVNPNWDTANWRLAEFVASSTDQMVVMTDWGMGNQAIAVTRGRSGRVADAWPSFSSDHGASEALDRHGIASLYCLRTPPFETMRGHRERFLANAAARGLAPLRVAAFANERGAEMIEVVRLVPLNGPSAGVR